MDMGQCRKPWCGTKLGKKPTAHQWRWCMSQVGWVQNMNSPYQKVWAALNHLNHSCQTPKIWTLFDKNSQKSWVGFGDDVKGWPGWAPAKDLRAPTPSTVRLTSESSIPMAVVTIQWEVLRFRFTSNLVLLLWCDLYVCVGGRGLTIPTTSYRPSRHLRSNHLSVLGCTGGQQCPLRADSLRVAGVLGCPGSCAIRGICQASDLAREGDYHTLGPLEPGLWCWITNRHLSPATLRLRPTSSLIWEALNAVALLSSNPGTTVEAPRLQCCGWPSGLTAVVPTHTYLLLWWVTMQLTYL